MTWQRIREIILAGPQAYIPRPITTPGSVARPSNKER
jgi:hypothetical protein